MGTGVNWDGRIRADARHIPLANESVQMVCTSPPYWGLRDYGQDGQIGLERTPREYINNIREVAFELWRVLRKDGTLWLNLGDSYSGSGKGGNPGGAGKQATNRGSQSVGVLYGKTGESARQAAISNVTKRFCSEIGFAPKQLIGIPWRVAFALQEDGWYLRRDIIWHKPNPMPESVTDRPTSSHEYIFLLTKSERYYYDRKAIAEPHKEVSILRRGRARSGGKFLDNDGGQPTGNAHSITKGLDHCLHPDGRNRRSVWTISTRSYPEAHYATFPEEIPEICIKAGTKRGDMVLDPFFGSGTVGRVAERLSRRWIGCDLGYQNLQSKRVTHVQKELII